MCIRQTITDKIITILEAGVTQGGPRWTQSAGHGMPRNAKTGDLYRGVNVLLLWAQAPAHVANHPSLCWNSSFLGWLFGIGWGRPVVTIDSGTRLVWVDFSSRPTESRSLDRISVLPVANLALGSALCLCHPWWGHRRACIFSFSNHANHPLP